MERYINRYKVENKSTAFLVQIRKGENKSVERTNEKKIQQRENQKYQKKLKSPTATNTTNTQFAKIKIRKRNMILYIYL